MSKEIFEQALEELRGGNIDAGISSLESLCLDNNQNIPPYYHIFLLTQYLAHKPTIANRYGDQLLDKFKDRLDLRIKVLTKLKRFILAIKILKQIEKEDEDRLFVLSGFAENCESAGNLRDAINYYKKCITLDKVSVEYNLKHARIYARMEDWEKEKVILIDLELNFPKNRKVLLHCIRRYIANGEINKSAKIFTILFELFPSDSMVMVAYLLQLLEENKYEKVLENIAELDYELQKSTKVVLRKSRALVKLNRIDNALKNCLELLKTRPHDEQLHCFYLQTLMKKQHASPQLRDAFEYADSLKFNSEKYHLIKSELLERKAIQVAISYLLNNINESDNYLELQMRLSKLYTKDMQYDNALQVLQLAQKSFGNNIKISLQKIRILSAANRNEECENLIEKALKVFDNHYLINKAKVFHLFRNNNFEKSIELSKKILYTIDDEDIVFNIIQCYLDLGKKESAYNKLIKLEKKYKSSYKYFNLAVLCLDSDDYEKWEKLNIGNLSSEISVKYLYQYVKSIEALGRRDLIKNELKELSLKVCNENLALFIATEMELARITSLELIEANDMVQLEVFDSEFPLRLVKNISEVNKGHKWLELCMRSLNYLETNLLKIFLLTRELPLQVLKIAEAIIEALFTKEPFSLIRLGDGEGNVLSYEMFQKYSEQDFIEIQNIWWGESRILDKSIMEKAFKEIVDNADIIGISEYHKFFTMDYFSGIMPPFSRHCRGDLAVNHYVERAPNLLNEVCITSCFIHFDLLTWGLYDYILAGVPHINLITCHGNLAEIVYERYNIKVKDTWLIPAEYKWKDFMGKEIKTKHYPNVFNEIMQNLSVSAKGELFFVAAGFLSKFYINRIKELGGIGIDIGGLADHWCGHNTRPSMPKLDEDLSLSSLHSKLYSKEKFAERTKNIFGNSNEDFKLTHLWINLDKDVERCNFTEKQFSELGVKQHVRIAGVTPNLFPSKIIHNDSSKSSMNIGEWGCLLAHLSCYKKMQELDLEVAFIQEDDLCFPYNIEFGSVIKSAPDDWEILHLYTSNPNNVKDDYTNYVRTGKLWNKWDLNKKYWCTMAYIIKRETSDRILVMLEPSEDVLDVSMATSFKPVADNIIYNLANTYVLSYPLFYARDEDSSIHPSHIKVHINASKLRKKQQLLEIRRLAIN